MAEEPADAILAEAVEQDVGERGAGLAFARRKSGHAMREMERQLRVRRENQEVLVPVLGRRRADRDLFRTRAAGGDQLAHPAQRFDDFGVGVGARDDLERTRRRRLRIDDPIAGNQPISAAPGSRQT